MYITFYHITIFGEYTFYWIKEDAIIGVDCNLISYYDHLTNLKFLSQVTV